MTFIMFRNKTQKRITALNRELPPRNEQFLLDFEQLQSQFPVSVAFECNFAEYTFDSVDSFLLLF